MNFSRLVPVFHVKRNMKAVILSIYTVYAVKAVPHFNLHICWQKKWAGHNCQCKVKNANLSLMPSV